MLVFRHSMVFPPNPEVLAADWLPPTLIGRGDALAELRRYLWEPDSPSTSPVLIEGPAGSGTSALARFAARERAVQLRDRARGPGQVVTVRTRWCSGTTGIAGALLRRFDEGFREKGFSVAEIMAGFLRRVARDARPTIVLLDDLGPAVPEIGPILRALERPERFLPEGIDHRLPLRVLLAGNRGGWGARAQVVREGIALDRCVRLDPYSASAMRAILFDRTSRALGAPPSAALVDRLAHRAMLEGRGASRAIELLREELMGPALEPLAIPFAPQGAPRTVILEPRILRAFGAVCAKGPAELVRIREWESRLARSEGACPLPSTTFWRRVVRLEQAGLIRRDVRAGGPGGSRSTVHLLRAVAQWRTVTAPSGNPRGVSGPWPDVGARSEPPSFQEVPTARPRPSSGPGPTKRASDGSGRGLAPPARAS
jgi:hypothetical protein